VRNSTVSQGVYDVKGDRLRRKRKPITTKRQIDKDRKTKIFKKGVEGVKELEGVKTYV
jgi:hypothetical protein